MPISSIVAARPVYSLQLQDIDVETAACISGQPGYALCAAVQQKVLRAFCGRCGGIKRLE
eukprot:s12623_g1.t1